MARGVGEVGGGGGTGCSGYVLNVRSGEGERDTKRGRAEGCSKSWIFCDNVTIESP